MYVVLSIIHLKLLSTSIDVYQCLFLLRYLHVHVLLDRKLFNNEGI